MANYPPATEVGDVVVHCIRRNISEADEGVGALVIGTRPAKSIVVSAGIIVATAFNGTSPIAQIGPTADPDGFGTNLILATIGNIVWDELATSNDLYSTSEVTDTVTVTATGNDSTAGYGVAYVLYVLNNGNGRTS